MDELQGVVEGGIGQHSPPTPTGKGDYLVALSLLVAITAAVLWAFLPEVAAGTLQFSDASFHLSILRQMDDAVRAGGSAFDFWYDASPFGYPLFRVYQSLPHLTMYGVYRVLGGLVPLETVYLSFTVLLAALTPWSVYLMGRLVSFPPLCAAFAGVLSVLVSEFGGYGMGMQNYSWGTHGLVSQLWGVVFAAPAIGFGYQYLRSGCRLPVALLFVFLACGSHLLSAHLIGFSLVVAACSLIGSVPPGDLLRRGVFFALGSSIAIAHQLLTLVSDSQFVHQSVLEPTWKFSSHGIRWTYEHFVRGELFDLGRYPVLSLLVVVGLALSVVDIVMPRSPSARRQGIFLLGAFALWLSLLAGYEVWGWLFKHFPILKSMHMHRFIVGVHLFGVLLGARALFEVSRLVPSLMLVVVLVVVVLYPVLKERKESFATPHHWISKATMSPQEEGDLKDLISFLRSAPRGRVYAGFASDWGQKLMVGRISPLYHALTVAGVPTLGILFHPFGLAGDVMFDFHPAQRERYDLFGVRYVVAPPSWQSPKFLRPVKSYAQYVLYEYPEGEIAALGRLAFEGWGSGAEAAQFMRRWIAFGLAQRGLYGEIVRRPSGELPGIFFGSVHLQPLNLFAQPINGTIDRAVWTQEGAELSANLGEAALVVLKIPFHGGWRIDVDGAPSPRIRWITPGFVGVDLSPGAHQISARYVPSRLKGVLFVVIFVVLLTLSARSLSRTPTRF